MGNHMARASAHHACAGHGDLKHPHLPNISRDIWLDIGWIGFWFVVGHGLWCVS